jgi:hypothetical protein
VNIEKFTCIVQLFRKNLSASTLTEGDFQEVWKPDYGIFYRLPVGLAFLAVGLAVVLAVGLAEGLAVGLAVGLAEGLAVVQAVGLAVGLSFLEAAFANSRLGNCSALLR